MPTSPTPLPTIPPFPALADKATGTYNSKAYDWATGWADDIAPAIEALADNAYDNAVEAAASANAAATSASTATTQASTATTQAGNASTSAAAAAASALTAVNAPGTSGTSTTSITVGAGTKTLTTQTGKAWVVGQPVTLARTSDPVATRMWGTISAYNSGSGSISIVVADADFAGTGTHTDWTIGLAGQEGPAGQDADQTTPTLLVGASATLVEANKNTMVVATATSTLSTDTPAALGDGWGVIIPAQTYQITINGTFADGATTKVVPIGSGALLQSNGTALVFTPFSGALPYLHARDEKASGNNAAAAVNATENVRELNTVKTNTISGASLASNRVTLPAGTYRVRASAPARSCNNHQLRLYNQTDNALLIAGQNAQNDSSYANTTHSSLCGRFTLAASKAVELRHYTVTGGSTLGTSLGSGVVEVYAEIEIWKEG